MARELFGPGGSKEGESPFDMPPGIPEIPPIDFDIPLPQEADLARPDAAVEEDIQRGFEDIRGPMIGDASLDLPPDEDMDIADLAPEGYEEERIRKAREWRREQNEITAQLRTGGGVAEELWKPIQEEMDTQRRGEIEQGTPLDIMGEEETLRNMMEMMIPRRRPAEFPSGDLDPYMTEDFDPLGRAQDYRRSVDVPPRPPETIDLPPGSAASADLLYRLGEGGEPDREHIDLTRKILGDAPEMRKTLEDIERPDLSEFHGRPRYESATAVMVRVPPQLRGRFGFSNDRIQKVSPEQAGRMAEYKRKASQDDALRVHRDRNIQEATIGHPDHPPGPERQGYRYVPRVVKPPAIPKDDE
jgi:hypothetical protein